MEVSPLTTTAISVLVLTVLILGWKVLNWLWLRPKKMERLLREQGLQGNPYRLLVGDLNQMFKMQNEAKSKPINLSDDIVPRLFSFNLQTVNKYGRNSFAWFGQIPRLIITDPDLVKDVFNKTYDFPNTKLNPLFELLVTGLVSYEGEKWAKHRKIINPAFSTEKLKVDTENFSPLFPDAEQIMLPTFSKSCHDMITKWEAMMSAYGSCEMDVWPSLMNLSCDVISRTAFGSSYEEGRRIFELLKEQAELTTKTFLRANIPGWRFLPTRTNRRLKEIVRDIQASLKEVINTREIAMKSGEVTKDDLLGILLESNQKEIQEHGNNKIDGMTIQDVIEECKLFYFAGQETTSSLLVWTMVLLSKYPDWQARAREEVLQVFGNRNPNFDGLSHLKTVTLILYEVLRLYPPVLMLYRTVNRDIKLGNLLLPTGVQVALPIILLHHSHELWGEDAKEFRPERFSGGVSKATKGRVSFFPFGWGPRICIGQNFAILEAKMALSMILKHFFFELSPTYTHAPHEVITIQPQYGAHIILQKI